MRTLSLGPLIAALSSSILSLTAGHHLSYVIAAVSGAGVTAIVPLAIFAVSTVIALISVAYLVKLAVSRAGNKKEIGLSGEKLSQSGHTVSQEPQKFVCKNFTNLENKSNMPTLTPPPVKPGAQPNSSPSVPPPPPQLSHSAAPPLPPLLPPPLPKGVPPLPSGSSNSPIQPCNAGLSAEIRNRSTELKKPNIPDIPKGGARDALLKEIRQGKRLLTRKEHDDKLKQMAEKKPGNNESGQQEDLMAELLKKLNVRRKGITGSGVYGKMSDMIPEPQSRSRSNSVSSSNSEESEQDWCCDEDEYPPHLTPPSDNEKRGKSPDSSCESNDDAKSKPTSPLLPPKPDNLQTRPKAPPVKKECDAGPVNGEIKDPSTLPVKERARMFENYR
ncbi:hypothetical protein [Wolbachia endosymbiont of Ctenocephalides felis wCfeJ]|uniref:hypothetical protein n=1 Tax=Wolbachia endosymbiont of Ctenocephalides felis wCfeJ TaxID=2732594 RepID=UPI00158262C5|nr:hypothetical protein [Wolbachia endosymbiont of Ctenocephalides felis wCfeJ]WCR57898.1 MAG: hypothetical protein PG980_000370 [Wolbachia endosymbiont of Ctenocephalides felis wCfeJ]